jgi:hypothetical protein
MSFGEFVTPLSVLGPLVLALIAAFLVVRDLGLNRRLCTVRLDDRMAKRFGFLLWLALTGFFVVVFRQLTQVLFSVYALVSRGLPFLEPDISPLAASVLTYRHMVEPAVWTILVILLARQLRAVEVGRVERATGWRPAGWQVALFAIALAGMLMWPLQLISNVAELIRWVPADNALSGGLDWLANSWPRFVVLLGSIAGYILGAVIARRLITDYAPPADGDDTGGRVRTAAVWLLVAAVLSIGVEHLLVLMAGLIALGMDVAGGLIEGTSDVRLRIQLVTIALPLLAYPMAADAMAAIDWRRLASRLRSGLPRAVRPLLLLTTASWMSWLLQVPEWLAPLSEDRLPLRPDMAVLASGVVVVAVWLAYQFYFRERPGRDRVE